MTPIAFLKSKKIFGNVSGRRKRKDAVFTFTATEINKLFKEYAMKKLLTIALCFTLYAASGQVTVTFPNLQSALDAMKLSTTSGVPKSYVDSAVGNKALQSYVVTSITNLQNWALNQLALKADKGSTGTATSEGQLINLPDQTWYKIIQPVNYGQSYSNGTKQGKWAIGGYKINPNTTGITSDRPDNVFTIAAYNIMLPNGSREFPNEGAIDASWETFWANAGSLPYGDKELHWPRFYSRDRNEHRLHSIYVNDSTGQARHDFEGNLFTWMYTRGLGQKPFTFAALQEASLELTAGVQGRKTGFTATDYNGIVTGLWNIGGEGFLKVPGFIDYNGYGKAKIILPQVSSSSVAGQNYYKTITVNGETFDVLIRK